MNKSFLIFSKTKTVYNDTTFHKKVNTQRRFSCFEFIERFCENTDIKSEKMNKQKISRIILKTFFGFIFALIFFGAEAKASYAAATAAPKISSVPPLEISGWIPY